ncbi:MAG: RHS repeat-associated core domain-containing protein [Gammaproteobacteria bacterium]|nr:MAG: RHS repeat-associated core domain-containing protein [Gammaproteobacteria bacterium]
MTTRRFTGQRHESGLPGGEGLYDYGARWYDAQVGRFVSADTIVPSPGNPQMLNRYAYVLDSPLRYNDPSGHCPVCIIIGAFLLGGATLGGSTATFPEGAYTPSLPIYRQGAVEVRQNRATIEALATDHVPAILLAAAIANQGNSWQRPIGLDWGERIQIAIGEHHQFKDPRLAGLFNHPSVGVGQIMPGEARELGYEGDTWGLLDDRTSIILMAAKLEETADAISEFSLGTTESFILLAIGNNIGKTVTGDKRFRAYGDVTAFLKGDREARTQLLKMMNWIGYLHAREGWSLPKGVDTNHIWQLLRIAFD